MSWQRIVFLLVINPLLVGLLFYSLVWSFQWFTEYRVEDKWQRRIDAANPTRIDNE